MSSKERSAKWRANTETWLAANERELKGWRRNLVKKS